MSFESIEAGPVQNQLSTSGQALADRIGTNTIFGAIAGFTQVATRLVTIPIVIAHLGLDGYGIWSIVMTAAAYMRFGGVGVKCAFQKYVAEATGTGDYEHASRLLSTGCALMFGLSVIGLIPVAIFSRELAQLAGVPPEFVSSSSSAISVLALIMVMCNVGAVFDAIVSGGHRIDIVRRFSTGFAVAEAVAIVGLLHFGYGLVAMASTMGVSEICFLLCCVIAARKVVPQIHIGLQHIHGSMLRELVRFAGSYQLVNVLQVVYNAILPITMLRVFGASYAGIYALTLRLIAPAQILQDSFLLPVLSGGSMVYASGAIDKMQALVRKCFKVTLAFSIIPMSFIACFGSGMILAWIGQAAPEFHLALVLVSIAGVFQAISLLNTVLYRISGNAVMDIVCGVLRITTLLGTALLARRLGFYGVLGSLAAAEMIAMFFMMYAVTRALHVFRPALLLADTVKVLLATAGIMSLGAAVTYVPLPAFGARVVAALQSGAVGVACLLALWPALWLSRFVNAAEVTSLLRMFLGRRFVAKSVSKPAFAIPE